MGAVQMIWHVLTFAFLIVIASTAVMTPILLFVFDLRSIGWMWQHAALFSAMIAPTDAVSVSSVLKKGMCIGCCNTLLKLYVQETLVLAAHSWKGLNKLAQNSCKSITPLCLLMRKEQCNSVGYC